MMYTRGPCDNGLLKMELPENTAHIFRSEDVTCRQLEWSLHENLDQLDDETSLACQIFLVNCKAQELYSQGRLENCLDMLLESLEVLRYHPSIAEDPLLLEYNAILLNNIGQVTFAQGELEESLQYVVEAIQIRGSTQDHFSASLWCNIGLLSWRLDHDLDEAERALTRSLQILMQLQGDCTPCKQAEDCRDIVTVQNLLLLVQAQRCSSPSDDSSLLLILFNQRSSLGYENKCVANTLCSLGTNYWKRGRLKIAYRFLSEALRVQNQSGASERSILTTLSQLGQVLHEAGYDVEAMTCFRKALHITGTSSKTESEQMKTVCATILYNIGMIQSSHSDVCDRERRKRALHSFRLCLDLRRDVFGVNHPAVASALHNIGILVLEDGQFSESLNCFQESLRVRKYVLGPDHYEVASSLRHIGKLFHDRGDFLLATNLYSEALSILRKSPVDDTQNLVEVLLGLGQTQQLRGLLDEALQSYNEAVTLLRGNRKENRYNCPNKAIIQVLTVMGNIYIDMSDLDSANTFFAEAAHLSGEKKKLLLEGKPSSCAAAA